MQVAAEPADFLWDYNLRLIEHLIGVLSLPIELGQTEKFGGPTKGGAGARSVEVPGLRYPQVLSTATDLPPA